MIGSCVPTDRVGAFEDERDFVREDAHEAADDAVTRPMSRRDDRGCRSRVNREIGVLGASFLF